MLADSGLGAVEVQTYATNIPQPAAVSGLSAARSAHPAASAVLDPDAPVVYLFDEVAWTQLVFNAQHSGSEGQ